MEELIQCEDSLLQHPEEPTNLALETDKDLAVRITVATDFRRAAEMSQDMSEARLEEEPTEARVEVLPQNGGSGEDGAQAGKVLGRTVVMRALGWW